MRSLQDAAWADGRLQDEARPVPAVRVQTARTEDEALCLHCHWRGKWDVPVLLPLPQRDESPQDDHMQVLQAKKPRVLRKLQALQVRKTQQAHFLRVQAAAVPLWARSVRALPRTWVPAFPSERKERSAAEKPWARLRAQVQEQERAQVQTFWHALRPLPLRARAVHALPGQPVLLPARHGPPLLCDVHPPPHGVHLPPLPARPAS